MGFVWKSRRGATLAELLVSLAMVAIMAAMVISFVMLLTQRNRTNAANEALQQDLQIVESGVTAWVESFASGQDLQIVADGKQVQVGESSYKLQFAYGKLTGALSDGRSVVVHTQGVQDITFEMMTNGAGEQLLFCTLHSESGTHTFCVNPYVGEQAGGGQ